MIDRKEFEEWAISTSPDFMYNYKGVFVWFQMDFWGLEEACKVEIFKQFKIKYK